MPNEVHLITYADRLGGTIPGLTELLQGPLAGLFGGVHLLPFYTPIDGADAGFDPTDHTQVDTRLGTWDDIAELARTVDITADLIVNHISASSPQFEDYLQHGDDSSHAGMVLTFDRVFPAGATEADLLALYRPRPGLPLTAVRLADRSRRIMWTTFTDQQIDLDVRHPAAQRYLQTILDRMADNSVSMVRLDAVGYAVKTAGTSSFMTPATYAFIDTLHGWVAERDMQVLAEIHSHYAQQQSVSHHVDRLYDFGLAPLVLHGLFTGDAGPLLRWMHMRPHNAVTVLDTHDGIGVLDVGRDVNDPDRAGLLDEDAIDALVEQIHTNTNGDSRRATGAAASNVDLYQVNTTYYEALGRDDAAYLLARALQLCTPGVPQIYYVGLLAGGNDMDLLAATGVGRDINRHRYTRDEIDDALRRPVVQRLLALIRFRNRHPAFGGSCGVTQEGRSGLMIRWEADADHVELAADLDTRTFQLRYSDGVHARSVDDLAALV